MDEYVFEDVVANSTVTCTYPDLNATRVARRAPIADGCKDAEPKAHTVFFPGCSNINYGLPLMNAVYSCLLDAKRVDGISLLCCGKILEYEPGAATVRPAYEQQFRQHIIESGVKRIIAACPNCVGALRPLLAADPRTADVQVVALPAELIDMGYRVDASVAENMVRSDDRVGAEGSALFCVKDSCPDRATGEFADALRSLMPDGMWVEPAHNRKESICCGSRPRAAGNMEAARKCTRMNADEAADADASALVTACMSCAFLLSFLQRDLPVFHYLELLFNGRIAWEDADQYMKVRFLFDDMSDAQDDPDSGSRAFMGISG